MTTADTNLIEDRSTNIRRSISMILLANVVVHVLAFLVGGFADPGLLIGAVVYAIGAYAIPRRWPVVAVLVFLFMMFGLWVALASALTTFGLLSALMWVIVALDVLGLVSLFLMFWRR